MSAMESAEETIELDLENRPVGLRRTKRDDPQHRANIPQASKRAALVTISTNTTRIQPGRQAKQSSSHERFNNQDENSSKVLAGKSFSANSSALPIQPFRIHEDQSENKSFTKRVPPQTRTTPHRLELHPGVTGLQRQPLTTLTLLEKEKDVIYIDESPMVLDESVNEETSKDEILPSDQCLLVTDYADEIYQYLREAELRHRPKPTYLRKQPDITAGMRSILVDWMVEVGEEYKLQTETLYLAVSYIDRFLSCMSVLRGKLQLVGTASMFIAAKFEEIYPPDVGEFVYITDDTYTKKQVLRMEHLILKVLSFDLAIPTVFYFLQRFTRLSEANNIVGALSQYICELTLLEAEPYLRYLPSIIAGSAICLANYICDKEPWSKELVQSTGYTIENFRECLGLLFKTLCNASTYPQQAVREKYRSSKFFRVSDIAPPVTLLV